MQFLKWSSLLNLSTFPLKARFPSLFLRKILDKYAKKEIDFAPELYKELRQLLEEK